MFNFFLNVGVINPNVQYYDFFSGEDIEISYKINWDSGNSKIMVYCLDTSYYNGDFGDKFDSEYIKAF